ncbi:site-2 protease family protein [Planctomicrobium sp. SH664]|uniref:site-2 protease family protein n=1 Tax=Planctomicrobium sp. SH664 TaxID=3448125 RepID=UPI003F5B2B39
MACVACMDIRQNPLWLSVWLGRWFHADVRINIWFLVFAIYVVSQLGMPLGLAVTSLLLFSVLCHEFGHVLAARYTGGNGHEVILWPLGGLTFATPGPSLGAEIWTSIAGVLVHAVLCLITLPVIIKSGQADAAMRLLSLPEVSLSNDLFGALGTLLFAINFKLLMVNLLPIYPLDFGQLFYTVARIWWDRPTARLGTLWVGIILSFIVLLVASMAQSIELMLIAWPLSLFALYEHWNVQIARQLDESFMDYDLSQGYTSLTHRDLEDDPDAPPTLGPIARWKQQRAEKRRQREQQERLETERRVDELLEKVHQHGMQSLSDAERRFLNRVSSHYRSQG